ncbi:hypothetical protein RHOSPDRAFT_29373 [Rhodotorula sp. JG-1b]|nr:hypothetical protein RHOSPDRAFT_29373 [Rhodotorula sp. JG-1b]
MPLPDVHPDGDPFAERDAQRQANSWLGRMEARARLQDDQAAEQHSPSSELVSSPAPTRPRPSAPPTSASSPVNSSRPKVSQSLGKDSRGKEILIIDSDDEDRPETKDAAGVDGLETAPASEAADPPQKLEDDADEDEQMATLAQQDQEEPRAEDDGAKGDEEGGAGGGGEDASETEAEEGSGDDDGDDDEDGTPVVGDSADEGEEEEEDEEEEDSEDDDDDDDDDEDDDTNSMTSEAAPRVKDGEIVSAEGAAKSPKKVSADGDVEMKEGEGAGGGEQQGENGAAPATEKKKRRRRRNRTPTPPPLGPKERRATVRLSITLPPRKDDSAPEFDILQLSKDAGFIKEEEVVPNEDGADANGNGDDEDASESDGQGGRRKKNKGKAVERQEDGTPGVAGENEPPKKKRKRGPNVVLGRFGGYDVNDPFVDDEDVALYEPKYTARPKREGYFICAGEVEVAARRGRVKGSKNKPKMDENGNPIPQAARRRSGKVVLGPDGKPPGEFSPELQEKLDSLKAEADKEPWIVKNKFPPHLKDELVKVSYFALEIGEYDDEFYAVMPKIFPYNLFTMKKLIKREVYPKRMEDLAQDLDQQLEILKEGIRRNWGPQREEFERRLAEYERKLALGDGTTASGGTIATMRKTPDPPTGPVFGNSPAISTPLIATVDGMNGSPAPNKDDADDKKGGARIAEEPKWRFRLDETMRMALWRASEIEDKRSDLTIEKQELEKATTRTHNREKPYSAKAARKTLYERVSILWSRRRHVYAYVCACADSRTLASWRHEHEPALARE